MYDYVLRRFCVKHLERNLVSEHEKDLKNLLWRLADVPTQADARGVLEDMRALNPTATVAASAGASVDAEAVAVVAAEAGASVDAEAGAAVDAEAGAAVAASAGASVDAEAGAAVAASAGAVVAAESRKRGRSASAAVTGAPVTDPITPVTDPIREPRRRRGAASASGTN
jgi:hypothetical protein